MASVAAGAHTDVLSAVGAMTATKEKVYLPSVESDETYEKLYAIYTQLHDAFGVKGTQSDLSQVMKQLIQIQKDSVK
jgi:L-ribulokinase